MSKQILIRTHDEEWIEELKNRIETELSPYLSELDTVNKEYLISIDITELP